MANSMPSESRPLIIGEVLFDRFPDTTEVLGGAPFNVAWHLQGFGAEPLLVSRVGNDTAGERVLDAMAGWGMDRAGIEVDPSYPTGAVQIHASDRAHSFEIFGDQAYDQISDAQLAASSEGTKTGLVYHGTLLMRTAPMRETLARFLAQTTAPTFVDVNLRAPWWRDEQLPTALRRATWVKVNDDEVNIIADRLDLGGESLETRARRLQERFALELLVVTLGAKGAFALAPGSPPAQVAPAAAAAVVDTVGAGDAFGSVVILGLLREWSTSTILERAEQFASRVVQQRGATSDDREVYSQLSSEWGV